MPKRIKVTKLEGRVVRQKLPAKLRIGTRKSGTSANVMSNVELQEVLADKNKARYHNSARAVLALRA